MPLNLGVRINTYNLDDTQKSTAWIVHDGNFEEKILSINLIDTKEFCDEGSQRFNKVQDVFAHDRRLMMKIPTNLTVFFPNVYKLDIKNCGLKSISKNDLKGLGKLREICLVKMDIEELPADLFKDLINLQIIGLQSNKIKFIGKGIFNGLKNLKFVDLSGNTSVNLVYAVETLNLTFPEVLRFYKFCNLNNYLDEVFHTNATQNLKPRNTSSALKDLRKILKSDDFKDFTIKIGENEFKVHKLMLAARSPKLAEMIKQNPDADELILEDIEVEVFKIILDFIYDDKVPEDFDDAAKVFIAAGKLKLGVLKNYAAAILLSVVTRFNAIEILQLAIKYDDDRLKAKCIEEIKKIFIDSAFAIDENFLENFEVLKVIVEKKLQADEEIRKAMENFNKMKM